MSIKSAAVQTESGLDLKRARMRVFRSVAVLAEVFMSEIYHIFRTDGVRNMQHSSDNSFSRRPGKALGQLGYSQPWPPASSTDIVCRGLLRKGRLQLGKSLPFSRATARCRSVAYLADYPGETGTGFRLGSSRPSNLRAVTGGECPVTRAGDVCHEAERSSALHQPAHPESRAPRRSD